jgi:serine/threonine protein kinase/tetratricopeptide (TPR) repeat protein
MTRHLSAPNILSTGTVIAGRFTILSPAGRGGMGTVYRAQDALHGRGVALKLMERGLQGTLELERFGREAQLLSELRHPAIVGYVAHGQTPEGFLYLAMEWLEGIDLAERLSQEVLSLTETLALLERVAGALAVAHGRGVVHRDVKPSNLFLRGGLAEQATLLDFGVVRQGSGPALTATGMMVGTPEYMAPEQVRGERVIGPAVDVFALGVVIYECLTGRTPFMGDHMASVLAAILYQEPAPVQSLRPAVPPALAALLERMLAKEPQARPADAAALAGELAALRALALPAVEELPLSRTARARRTPGTEQRLFSVVLATPESAPIGEAATIDASENKRFKDRLEGLRTTLQGLGAQAEWIADGSLVVTLTQARSATDLAALAARCALIVHAQWPEARVALATGRGALHADLPVGEVLTRVAALLRAPEGRGGPPPGQGVLLDELSAGLLGSRFVISREGDRVVLQGSLGKVEPARLLLGKPTPCVGREQELSLFDGLLAAACDESVAKAVLVTAPPGVGKSRLRHELLRRLAGREPMPTVLLGHGDMMSAGAPHGVLGQAVRQLCGVNDAAAVEEQRSQLGARVAMGVAPAEQRRVLEFLGELCHVRFPDEASAQLRTARGEPKLMSEQIHAAFIDFLRAECALAPVVLIVEDLQWADSPTVKLLEAALRELADQPLLMVALGRPEVHELFPRLWSGSGRNEMVLSGLGRKASERLARQVLGPAVAPEVVERIVTQAAGNALFLEELIRAVAEGKEELPQTVLAMLQARLSCLDSEARRVVRAASVFGPSFWRGGVAELVGMAPEGPELERCIEALCADEIIERRRASRFGGEDEYGFRHLLMREAAYDFLDEEERGLWHCQAARFLERVGERDPSVVAEHYQRGGELVQAARWYLRAVDESLASNDTEGARACIARGLDCRPDDRTRGQLLQQRGVAEFLAFQWKEAEASASAAVPLLTVGSAGWLWACLVLVTVRGLTAEDGPFLAACEQLWAAIPSDEAPITQFEAVGSMVMLFALRGLRAPAERCRALLQALAVRHATDDAYARGWIQLAESEYLRVFDPHPWEQYATADAAAELFGVVGHSRYRQIANVNASQALGELGRFEEGEARLRGLLAQLDRRLAPYVYANVAMHLVALLVQRGRPVDLGEAETILDELAATGASSGYRLWAHGLVAEMALRRGRLDAASEAVRVACTPSPVAPLRQLRALALRTDILVRQGALDEARALVEEQLARIAAHGGVGYCEIPVRLAVCTTLAAREPERAREVLAAGIAMLGRRAATLLTPADRERYLTRVPENAAAIAQARAWGLDVAALLDAPA